MEGDAGAGLGGEGTTERQWDEHVIGFAEADICSATDVIAYHARHPEPVVQGNLVERGHLAGAAQRRCLPILRRLVGRVRDEYDIPLELQRYLTREGLALRVNLPLDEEAGAKLGLIFRLQERLIDLDRVELIARRVARFSREEALYWLSRTTSFEPDANRWAVAGLRLMLGGQAHDPAVERMLQRLREST